MVTEIAQSKFMQIFSILPDPRKPRNQLHSLPDILSTAILAILCGYEDWEDVSLWAEGHLPWLQSLGICGEGAPSHDAYNRFFRFLDPLSWSIVLSSGHELLLEKFRASLQLTVRL